MGVDIIQDKAQTHKFHPLKEHGFTKQKRSGIRVIG